MKATSQTDLTTADRRRLYAARDEVYDPQTFATTEPGDDAPDREKRPPSGSGIVRVVMAVLAAALVSQLLYALAQLVGRP